MKNLKRPNRPERTVAASISPGISRYPEGAGTMAAVFSLGRRAIDLAVLFLAVYALAFVPLGHRTGFEHFRAILRTRAAREAGRELEAAAVRLGRRLVGSAAPTAPRGVPVVPALPRQANAAASLSRLRPAADGLPPGTPSRATASELGVLPSEAFSIAEDRCGH